MSSMRDRILENAKKAMNAKNKKDNESKFNSGVHAPEGVKFLKVKSLLDDGPDGARIGFSNLDIIPYKVSVNNNPLIRQGELSDSREYYRHGGLGVDDKEVFICPRSIGEKCPICEELSKLYENFNANKTLIKSIKGKRRVLYNVINTANPTKEIMIFDTSWHTFTSQIIKECYSDPENANYPCLKKGLTLKVRWSEKAGEGYAFQEADRIDFIPREDYDESILDKVNNLDACLEVLSYDELRKKALLIEDEQEDDNGPDVFDQAIEARNSSIPEDVDEIPMEEPEPLPKRTRVRQPKPVSVCPHGLKFGVDTGQKPCCDNECNEDTWNKCWDLKESNEK